MTLRTHRNVLRSGALIITVSVLTLATSVFTHSRVNAIGSFDNAAIAQKALSYNGQNWGEPNGECRAFVAIVVSQVSGGKQDVRSGNGGYFQAFLNAGGERVTDENSLVEGDVVQRYPDRLHTWIVVKHISGDNFDVVDSNENSNDTVSEHRYNFALNDSVRAYRMGTVEGGISASGAFGGAHNSSGSNNSAGSSLTPTSPSTISAISRDPNSMDLFYNDGNNRLVNKFWNSVNGWNIQSWPDDITGIPAAITRSSTDMDVFYATAQGKLVNRGWNANSGWGGPTVLVNSGVAGSPAAVVRSSIDMDVEC